MKIFIFLKKMANYFVVLFLFSSERNELGSKNRQKKPRVRLSAVIENGDSVCT